jgi:hypothetical protein
MLIEIKKKNINLLILFFSFTIFLIRWYLPILNFKEELDISLIFESVSDGYYYFTHFKALANLDLNNSFDPLVNNLSNYPIPTAAFTVHFIFYKIFGSIGFVICEFIFILLFLIIFYKISRLLNFNRVMSLLISFLLFNIPNFLQILNIDHLQYISVIFSEFYSLRFPRPLVSNIFFFIFILFIMKLDHKNIFNKKNSIILGVISGLSFTSFFYVFILEQLFLLIFLFYIFKLKLFKKLKKNFKYLIFYLLTFLLVSAPFLINMNFTEIEFLERTGLVNLNSQKKIILFKYLFVKLFKYQFLIILFLSIFLFKIINSQTFLLKFKRLNVFFILFYSSILSPFIFALTSPIFYSHFYLFNNLIVICAFLMIFFTTISLVNFYLIKNFLKKNLNNICLSLLLIFLVVSFYQTNQNYNTVNLEKKKIQERTEFKSITNIIKNINVLDLEDSSLLTFDNKFLVWSILKDIKYLNIINGVMVPKKNEMIESDLIKTFKFLKLNKQDFSKFIENKKISSWRYRNENIKNLFWMRYQANSLITHKGSKNFDPDILNFINKSSPLLSQQLIMPNNETKRLILKFDEILLESYQIPKMIIVNKKNPVLLKSKIDPNIFCKAFNGNFYDFYYNLTIDSNCNDK